MLMVMNYVTFWTYSYQLVLFKNRTKQEIFDSKIETFFSYSACIRRAAGYCCIEYQVCAGVPSAFSLDGGQSALGSVDTLCTADYVAIPGRSCLKV